MSDCLFCKIAEKKIPSSVVYDDEDCLAFLDISPANKGHTLLIPKKHATNFDEIDQKELKHIIGVAQKINHAIKGFCEGTNILINNGSVAGQGVNHFHLHIIPKHTGDNWKLEWSHKTYEDDMQLYAERIKLGLEKQ